MTNKAAKLKALGKNIQRARRNAELSQNELAEKLDISREHLAKIETAKRCISLGLLFRLAEVLGIAEKELFEFNE